MVNREELNPLRGIKSPYHQLRSASRRKGPKHALGINFRARSFSLTIVKGQKRVRLPGREIWSNFANKTDDCTRDFTHTKCNILLDDG